MKLILFDIDGTILNSDGAGRTAVHAAVREYLQLPHDPPAIRFDGKTDPQIIRELFEAAGANGHDLDAAITEVGGRYVRHLERALAADAHEVRLLPGVSTLLDAVE
ncbi:MAG: HAD hydrolase-like protein, partial [Gemmatimonadales bacterium]